MDTTESMARKKFCCVYGRNACAASDCMAWRWHFGSATRMRIYCADPHLTDDSRTARPLRAAGWIFAPWDGSDYPAQWLEPEDEHQARRTGYCGLAGTPVKA
jgi:hypothetical protein